MEKTLQSEVVEEKEQTWRFTFGCGHTLANHCQPIIGTFASAREKMFELYGENWCAQYSEEEWENIRNMPDRFWRMEEDLEVVKA